VNNSAQLLLRIQQTNRLSFPLFNYETRLPSDAPMHDTGLPSSKLSSPPTPFLIFSARPKRPRLASFSAHHIDSAREFRADAAENLFAERFLPFVVVGIHSSLRARPANPNPCSKAELRDFAAFLLDPQVRRRPLPTTYSP
jgi:hypothetical protein